VAILTKVSKTMATKTTGETTTMELEININIKIKNQPQNFFQNNQPNPKNQMVVYTPNNNPGVAGRKQGDHSHGT
jgi:hypothetical protein